MSTAIFRHRDTEFRFTEPFHVDHNHFGGRDGRPFLVERAVIREDGEDLGRYIMVVGRAILADGSVGRSTSRAATYALTSGDVNQWHKLAPGWLLEALPEWALQAVPR